MLLEGFIYPSEEAKCQASCDLHPFQQNLSARGAFEPGMWFLSTWPEWAERLVCLWIPLWSSWQDHGKILWSCARHHLGVPGGSQMIWWLEFCNDIFTLQNVFDQFLVVLKGIISVALMEECFSFLKECQTKENLSLSQIINCIGTLLLEGFTNAYYNLSQRITWISTLVLEGFTLHHHSTAYFNLSQTIHWIGTLLLEGFTNAYYSL